MSTLVPYLYWFAFADPVAETDAGEAQIYFYQCLILSPAATQAQAWGDVLAAQFRREGEALRIEQSWLEAVVPTKLTQDGMEPIGWLALDQAGNPNWYQGTAEPPDTPYTGINALIEADSVETARRLWERYVATYYPTYEITTCSTWSVPVIQLGTSVVW